MPNPIKYYVSESPNSSAQCTSQVFVELNPPVVIDGKSCVGKWVEVWETFKTADELKDEAIQTKNQLDAKTAELADAEAILGPQISDLQSHKTILEPYLPSEPEPADQPLPPANEQ